jgi:hypothetical protein
MTVASATKANVKRAVPFFGVYGRYHQRMSGRKAE